MLDTGSRKDRTIFYNQKKKTLFYQRMLVVCFLLTLVGTYVIYENFLFIILNQDESMSPNILPEDIVFFRPVDLESETDLINLIPRGSIIVLRKSDRSETSIIRKILDIPVYLLTLGWVKLDHRRVVVRRIVAFSGEKIEIKNKVIYLNNKVFLPDWIIRYQDVEIFPNQFSPRDNLQVRYIDKNHVFVLNDNWDQVNDSRLFGEVKMEDIEGILIYKYSSFKE